MLRSYCWVRPVPSTAFKKAELRKTDKYDRLTQAFKTFLEVRVRCCINIRDMTVLAIISLVCKEALPDPRKDNLVASYKIWLARR